jgi:hypothetical protein
VKERTMKIVKIDRQAWKTFKHFLETDDEFNTKWNIALYDCRGNQYDRKILNKLYYEQYLDWYFQVKKVCPGGLSYES